MNQITIRGFNPETDCCDFIQKYVEKHFTWNSLLKDLESDGAFPHLLVAEYNTKIIGMMLLHTNVEEEIYQHNFAPSDSIWIYRLRVHKDFQRQGIGKRLIKEAENYMIQNKETYLWLDTDIPDVLEYYKSLGYDYIRSIPYKDTQTHVYHKKLI